MKDKNSRGILFDVVVTIKGTDTLNAISNEKTGYPLVMYYNAAGDSAGANGHSFESIAMAVSNDMQHWQRKGDGPFYYQKEEAFAGTPKL